ncbi:MAG: substrate-binding domain-containing protein [Calditrichota bacterium]
MKRTLVAILLITMVLAGCGKKKPQESMTAGHARIGAADAVFEVAWFLSREFQAGNQAAFIDIFRDTDQNLVNSLLNKESEEVFLDRALTPAETLALDNAGLKRYSYPIAYYPVYWIVDMTNPVSVIDSAHLRGVLTGKITNWRELGGADLPINVYLPLPGEGAMQSLVDFFGVLDSLQAAAICSTMSAMLDSARGDDGALLLYSKPIIELPYKALWFQRGEEQVRPNVKTILDEVSYPFRLDITYVTTHNKMDVAAGYLTFAVGNLGQRRIMDALKYRPASVPVRVVKMK